MKRLLCASMCVLLSASGLALARRVYIPPLPERLAQAELVVIGKVAEIEKKSIVARAFPNNPQKYEYQIMVVKIDKALVGGKGLTHVRVGFRGAAVRKEEDRRNRATRVASSPLTVGVEGCFLLKRNLDQPFYELTTTYAGFVAKKDDPAGFATAEVYAKILEDPLKALKAKKADDRFVAAAVLLARYRSVKDPSGQIKKEPINAAESKLILAGLRDADWNRRATDQLHPQRVFSQLGLTAQNGWKQPKDFKEMPAAAKAWLTKHAGSYRVQRLVAVKK